MEVTAHGDIKIQTVVVHIIAVLEKVAILMLTLTMIVITIIIVAIRPALIQEI